MPRLLHNGTLIYPRRGRPPEVPEGYLQERGDPFILHPIIKECKFRKSEISIGGKCKCRQQLVNKCDIYGRISLQQCVGCEDRKGSNLMDKTLTFMQAMVKHKLVRPEIAAERHLICLKCEYNKEGSCSLCGCPINRLMKHEENLPQWGCKHPRRGEEGWPI